MDSRPVPRAQILSGSRIGERTDVVDERIGPDVGNLALIPGQRDPPWLAGARDAEVAKTAGDERARLVVAEVGPDKFGALVVEREQPFLIGGEPEEVVLLFDPLGLREVDRAEPFPRQLLLVLELLAADAVPAGVDVLVDVAVVVHLLQELTDEALVALVACLNEEVDRC